LQEHTTEYDVESSGYTTSPDVPAVAARQEDSMGTRSTLSDVTELTVRDSSVTGGGSRFQQTERPENVSSNKIEDIGKMITHSSVVHEHHMKTHAAESITTPMVITQQINNANKHVRQTSILISKSVSPMDVTESSESSYSQTTKDIRVENRGTSKKLLQSHASAREPTHTDNTSESSSQHSSGNNKHITKIAGNASEFKHGDTHTANEIRLPSANVAVSVSMAPMNNLLVTSHSAASHGITLDSDSGRLNRILKSILSSTHGRERHGKPSDIGTDSRGNATKETDDGDKQNATNGKYSNLALYSHNGNQSDTDRDYGDSVDESLNDNGNHSDSDRDNAVSEEPSESFYGNATDTSHNATADSDYDYENGTFQDFCDSMLNATNGNYSVGDNDRGEEVFSSISSIGNSTEVNGNENETYSDYSDAALNSTHGNYSDVDGDYGISDGFGEGNNTFSNATGDTDYGNENGTYDEYSDSALNSTQGNYSDADRDYGLLEETSTSLYDNETDSSLNSTAYLDYDNDNGTFDELFDSMLNSTDGNYTDRNNDFDTENVALGNSTEYSDSRNEHGTFDDYSDTSSNSTYGNYSDSERDNDPPPCDSLYSNDTVASGNSTFDADYSEENGTIVEDSDSAVNFTNGNDVDRDFEVSDSPVDSQVNDSSSESPGSLMNGSENASDYNESESTLNSTNDSRVFDNRSYNLSKLSMDSENDKLNESPDADVDNGHVSRPVIVNESPVLSTPRPKRVISKTTVVFEEIDYDEDDDGQIVSTFPAPFHFPTRSTAHFIVDYNDDDADNFSTSIGNPSTPSSTKSN